jgi:dTDP-4-dehydrorhamnose reductase
MKVLITGANGMLGSNLVKLLPLEKVRGLGRSELDITNQDNCIKVLEKEKPEIVIHTAAYTNVEDCEINQDKAYLLNVIGTQNLVNYCISKEVLFIYISSTGIYGSKKENTPYNEFDEVNPTTIHHKSKYEAEKIVQNHLSRFLVLRTGWLFGGDKTHNKNFVYKRYLEANQYNEIYSDDSQIGNPTYIKDLVHQISILIKNNQYGIYNCANYADSVSRYDYVKKIVEYFNVDCEVKIASKGSFKRVAPVSNNESSENYKLKLLGLNVMDSWDSSLEKYIEELKKKI